MHYKKVPLALEWRIYSMGAGAETRRLKMRFSRSGEESKEGHGILPKAMIKGLERRVDRRYF